MTSAAVVVNDIVDITKSINGHSFTIGWLLDSLRNNDEKFIKLHGNRPVKEVIAKNISEGQGFISYVYRCKIIFVDSTDEDSDAYTTILKIPTFKILEEAHDCIEEGLPKEYQEGLTEIHNVECEFYNHFAEIVDIPLAKVFKTVNWVIGGHEGCIHMEDLTQRGKCISHFESVNLVQVKAFIRHLAHLHKNILCYDTIEWKGKYLKNATLFGDFMQSADQFVDGFLEKCKRKAEFEPLIKRYRKYTLNQDYIYFANVQAHKDLGMPPVIVHGDMFAGNIMWAIDKNGDIQNDVAAFIDWQILHEGSPMSDLSCFLTLCVDGVVRRQAEQFAIPYYYDCLVKEYGGDKTKVPYTVEQLQTSYDYFFMSHGFHTLGLAEFMIKPLEKKEIKQSLKGT